MAKGRKRILYKLRMQLGLTPDEMAILLHKDVQTIRAYETEYICKTNIGRKPTCLGVVELLTLLKLGGYESLNIKIPWLKEFYSNVRIDDLLKDFNIDIEIVNERISQLEIKKSKEK
jgi:hypothetical protein